MLFTLFNEKGMEETIQCTDGLYIKLVKTAKVHPKKGLFLRIDQTWAFNEIKNSAG